MDFKSSQTLIDAIALVNQNYDGNPDEVEYATVYVAQEAMEGMETVEYVSVPGFEEPSNQVEENPLSIAKPDNYIYQLLLKSQRGIMLLAAYEIDQETIKSKEENVPTATVTGGASSALKTESFDVQSDEEDYNYEDEEIEADDGSMKFSRAQLSGLIIENEFWFGRYDIGKDRFNFLADSIVELFPTEKKDMYYSESSVVNGVNQCSRGVLYNKYKKIRQECIDLRLLVARKNKKTVAKSSFAALNALKNIENRPHIIHKSLDKQFLKNWDQTADERKKSYEITPIKDIFKRFPNLNCTSGYSLLLRDLGVEQESMEFGNNRSVIENTSSEPDRASGKVEDLCEFFKTNQHLFTMDNVSPNNYLYKLLLSSQRGIMLLASYKHDRLILGNSTCDNLENELENDDDDDENEEKFKLNKKEKFNRFQLSMVITENEFYQGRFDLSRQRFDYLTDSIVELFPTEKKSTYYRESGKTKSQVSKGILYNRYRKLRQECLPIGLLECNRKRKRGTSPTSFANSELFASLRVPVASISPAYLKQWRTLVSDRRKLFKESSLKELFSTFPSLATCQGYTLLLDDFNEDSDLTKYSSNFVANWPKIAKHIIGIAKAKKNNELITKILEENKKILSPVHEQNLALTLLPMVLGPITVGTKKNESEWKTTDQDTLDSFVLQAKDHEDLLKRQATLKKSYEDHKLAIQPYVVFIGNLSENTTSYVVVNDYRYFANSLVEAIDICFKCTNALQHMFMRLSAHVWQFLQYHAYAMPMKSVYSAVSDLSTRIDRKKSMTPKKAKTGAPSQASTSNVNSGK